MSLLRSSRTLWQEASRYSLMSYWRRGVNIGLDFLYLVATSQCSAIFPLSMRNISNQVVVYFWSLFLGSGISRTNDKVT